MDEILIIILQDIINIKLNIMEKMKAVTVQCTARFRSFFSEKNERELPRFPTSKSLRASFGGAYTVVVEVTL